MNRQKTTKDSHTSHRPRLYSLVMSRVLIIDDDGIRVPALSWFARGTYLGPDAEIVYSETFVADWDDFDMVMLDHDLGPGGDMYDHVRRVFPEGYDGPARIVIHSMNPVGAANLVGWLGTGVLISYGGILKAHTTDYDT